MIINADLHIHSHYSIATSEKMNIETLSLQAPSKGIDVMATGDCLNSGWIEEIKTCNIIDDGTFEMNGTRFILSAEIEDRHRVHHLLYFPCLSAVEEFKDKIKHFSVNIETDGRPNVHLCGEDIASIAKDFDILIGPAHAFTPWTSMYAKHSSLHDCYGQLTDYISFLELGLSADSNYADKIKELHRLTFLTNSDCHSPHPVRLAREFNRFEVNDSTFNEIKKAILRIGGNKTILNVGLPPEEGKYNESACISCYTHFTLKEAIRRQWKCSCGKKIKKGVKDRIDEQANHKKTNHPDHRPPYLHLIPLPEIITKAVGQRSPFTKTVTSRWNELISEFGTEITVLIDTNLDDISRVTTPVIAEAIRAFREKKIHIIPGGGGKYGTIQLPEEQELLVSIDQQDHQTSLFEY
ncbi:MAG: TIGR00375 family protein [Thermoplasmata archaeon]|nr:MAG: TIGR00375 family protein [Thermoplasmata archaeon]